MHVKRNFSPAVFILLSILRPLAILCTSRPVLQLWDKAQSSTRWFLKKERNSSLGQIGKQSASTKQKKQWGKRFSFVTRMRFAITNGKWLAWWCNLIPEEELKRKMTDEKEEVESKVRWWRADSHKIMVLNRPEDKKQKEMKPPSYYTELESSAFLGLTLTISWW